jgi:mono/diheme cytochrome c family protein/glucose/arabinose dehydrogenase
MLAGVATAIHPQNAGPADFTIKFKLPPPKPLTAEEELKTFKLEPGFHAELVAAEPMVDTPVSASWDEQGRLFVLEMRGYMHDVEGLGEDQPLGRIVMLEDTDGDGKMDKRTVFADELVLPRAIVCTNGGLLVGEPPMLWFMKDTDGDGKADTKEPVDKNFGSRSGQPEHMVNSPLVAQDNWIYFANHHSRYRFKDGKWWSEAVQVRGQWGLSQDDYGHLFYNYNSDFLRASFVPDFMYLRNPNFPCAAGGNVQIQKLQTCWPSHPTPGVNRGYEPASLREDGTLKSCTATCGAGIYRGGLFPKAYAGNAFVPEPSGNLVKRLVIAEKDGELTAQNAYEKKEFMTSTDERFRPVNAYTAPDGSLYLIDMYRGVIQHKGFLTFYLVQNIKDRKLEEPFNCGRIWRIVPDGKKPVAPKMPTDTAGLVKALDNPNGWVRDTAQRVLAEKKDPAAPAALAATLKSGSRIAKLHALWAIDGIGLPATETLTAALREADPKIRAAAVRIADRTMEPQLAQMIGDSNKEVQVALAFALGGLPEAQEPVVALARLAAQDLRVRDGIVSGLRGRELEVLQAALARKAADETPAALPDTFISALAQAVMTEKRSARVKQLITLTAEQKPNSPAQLALLAGASGKAAPKPPGAPATTAANAPKAKVIYIDAEAPELASMNAKANDKAKPLLAALDARIGWPDKPGFPPPPVIKPLTPEEQALFDGGKVVYTTLCAACHQPTGVGMPGLAPALVDSSWVLGEPKILPRIVIHGLGGPLNVGGQVWNLEMPPLGPALSDEQIAGVLTYIRREWEHGASPISVKFVAEIREQNKARTTAWNAEDFKLLLAKTPPKEPVKATPKGPAKPAVKEPVKEPVKDDSARGKEPAPPSQPKPPGTENKEPTKVPAPEPAPPKP